MGYKVDYSALDSWGLAIRGQASAWLEKLTETRNKMQVLCQSNYMSGQTADNLKNYITQIHMTLLGQLSALIYLHNGNAQAYVHDYQKNVDTSLHVLILEEELDNLHERLEDTEISAIRIADSLGYTMRGIGDIFSLNYADVSEVETAHRVARNHINQLHEKIKTLEKTHKDNDFAESNQMLTALRNMINEMQYKTREFRSNYSPETTLSSSNWKELYAASVAVQETVQEKEEIFTEAIENQTQRVAEYKAEEEAKEDREWAKWLAVGVAVVGSVALIVVTAGGATPLVCAGVGAAAGLATAASSGLANEYVEHGSLDNMDWSEFGKDCLIGTATGAIGGYAGALSTGSAIQQPIKAGIKAATTSVAKNVTGGAIDTVWDVGEAWVTCQPGDKITSVLLEDIEETLEKTVVEGVGDFAGGMVAGSFKVDASKKDFLGQLKADTAENAAKAVAENFTGSVWDVGEAVFDGDESTTFTSALKEETVDFIGGTAKDFVSEEIESVISGGIDAYQDKNKNLSDTAEVIQNVLGDTAGKTAGSVAGGVVEQSVEWIGGERDSVDMKEIFEKELDGGRKIVQNAADSIAENVSEKAYEDKEFYIKMQRKANKDGTVEVMEFDKYKVLKEDVEAAKSVAGKGAYKDKTVNDILGLSKKEKVDFENPEYKKVDITDLEKSKYTTKKPTNAYTVKRATKATKKKYENYK